MRPLLSRTETNYLPPCGAPAVYLQFVSVKALGFVMICVALPSSLDATIFRFGGPGEVPMALVVATCPQCRTEEEVANSADQHVGQWGPVVSVLMLCDDCRGFQKALRENYYSPAGELAA